MCQYTNLFPSTIISQEPEYLDTHSNSITAEVMRDYTPESSSPLKGEETSSFSRFNFENDGGRPLEVEKRWRRAFVISLKN